MDDKDNSFFDSNKPLILEKEVDNILVLNKELTSSQSNKDSKKNEILKIKDLIELKYSSPDKNIHKTTKSNFEKEFSSIKDSAKKINKDIKEKTILINDSIDNQKHKIQLLYKEKKSLDQNRLEFNENKNKIQTDIIDNQQKLIESNKKDISIFKKTLDNLEKKFNESTLTNRSLEINNHELKKTVSKYIVHSKILENKINESEKIRSETTKIDSETSLSTEQIDQINNRIDSRIKYYQEENIRLSSELSSFQKKYEIINKNFTEVEFEKNSIFQQIQELNNSLNKTDFSDKSLTNEKVEIDYKNNEILEEIADNDLKNNQNNKNDKKPKNELDDGISDIFN